MCYRLRANFERINKVVDKIKKVQLIKKFTNFLVAVYSIIYSSKSSSIGYTVAKQEAEKIPTEKI